MPENSKPTDQVLSSPKPNGRTGVETLCLRVPKRHGEVLRAILTENEILDKDLKPLVDDHDIYFPLSIGPEAALRDDYEVIVPSLPGTLLQALAAALGEHPVFIIRRMKGYRKRPKSYHEYLRGALPHELYDQLPRAYDVIGTIAMLKLPDDLCPYGRRIGEALLTASSKLRTVMNDSGVAGEYRVRNLEHLAGEPAGETVHKEYGIRIRVDPTRVYFSPRLAGERHRVAATVVDGETIIDMFTGVGPFALAIASVHPHTKIYAIDINPDAITILKTNLDCNRISTIIPIQGDARDVLRSGRIEPADRIIMNLPHSARQFLPEAIGALKERGIIHYYEILEEEMVGSGTMELEAQIIAHGRTVAALDHRVIHRYSPTQVFMGWDIVVGIANTISGIERIK